MLHLFQKNLNVKEKQKIWFLSFGCKDTHGINKDKGKKPYVKSDTHSKFHVKLIFGISHLYSSTCIYTVITSMKFFDFLILFLHQWNLWQNIQEKLQRVDNNVVTFRRFQSLSQKLNDYALFWPCQCHCDSASLSRSIS